MKPQTQITNTLFDKIIDHKRQISTYITDKFSVTSNRGNKYLLVLYKYNINIILILPIKAISYSEFIQVIKGLHEHLLARGDQASIHDTGK